MWIISNNSENIIDGDVSFFCAFLTMMSDNKMYNARTQRRSFLAIRANPTFLAIPNDVLFGALVHIPKTICFNKKNLAQKFRSKNIFFLRQKKLLP